MAVRGRLLLDRNPLKELRKPREKKTAWVVLTEDECGALFGVSRHVGWRFHVALVLAHETGHRIGAIRKLLWAGVPGLRFGPRKSRNIAVAARSCMRDVYALVGVTSSP